MRVCVFVYNFLFYLKIITSLSLFLASIVLLTHLSSIQIYMNKREGIKEMNIPFFFNYYYYYINPNYSPGQIVHNRLTG